jgi:flavin reductase (DIM6/NTAB) family NADH-FMN oxidoreductase RutF
MSSKRVPEGEGGTDTGTGPVSAALFRKACSRFATGIAVVTALDGAGRPHGLTVNSFSSVSLEPPLILVSIDLRNPLLGHFPVGGIFGVNILAEGQEELSRRFSSEATRRFAGVTWQESALGAPLLEGVLAQFECAVVHRIEAGDHAVLLGEVRGANISEGEPLVYFGSAYRRLGA